MNSIAPEPERGLPRLPAIGLLVVAMLALALIAGGCGSDDASEETTTEAAAETTESEPEPEPAEPAGNQKPKPEPKGTALTTAGSQFGDVLFDEDQRAIYIFDKEQTSESQCYGDCAVEWPPVLTKGDPQAEGDVKSGKLGTTKRDDGKLQVTYDGQPLYYYQDDPDGVVGCHNVPGFGGLWLAIDASGAAV